MLSWITQIWTTPTNKVEYQTIFTNVLNGGSNLKGNIKTPKKKLAHNTKFKLLHGLKTK
jgi:hypothetical protein